MDPGLQEVLKLDRERAKSGVRFPLPLVCVKDPLSSECTEILEIIGSLPAHNFSAGADSSPGFSSIMDYPYPMGALSSPLSLELSDYDVAALRVLYSRQVGTACKDDPNSKRCVTLIEAMALHGRSSGMRHKFSAGDESSSDRADTFSGEQTSTPSVMDYGTLQLHQQRRVVGVPHYELNESDIEKLRKYYKGTEAR